MPAKIITIASGKGGVGKTTTTANVSIALAKRGRSVCCMDMDIGLRNLDVILGLEDRIIYDLVDVVEGRARLRQALIKDKRFPDLALMPAAQRRDKNAVNEKQVVRLCEDLRREFDYVLLDAPAGIEQGYRNAVAPADLVLVVTTPEVSAVRDADRVIGLLRKTRRLEPRLILNRFRSGMVSTGDMLSVRDVVELLGIDLIGLVPEDETVISASNLGEPVSLHARSSSGKEFNRIAARLDDESVPVPSLDGHEKVSLFSRIQHVFRPG